MRVVLVEVHFLYGWNVKFLKDKHGELRVREMEATVADFLDKHELVTDVFNYEVRGVERIDRVQTLIVEIKVGHLFLSRLQSLPWDDLILFSSRAIYKNHRETEE